MQEPIDSIDPTKFDPKTASVLSYILPPITGILFFLLEKKDKTVRFHAFQSILFGVVGYGIYLINESLTLILIGYIFKPIIMTVLFITWITLMWKAYNQQAFMIPFLGRIAKEQSEK